jgi:hypothetical protein
MNCYLVYSYFYAASPSNLESIVFGINYNCIAYLNEKWRNIPTTEIESFRTVRIRQSILLHQKYHQINVTFWRDITVDGCSGGVTGH